MLFFFKKTNINIHPIAIVFYITFFINYYSIYFIKKETYRILNILILILSCYIIFTSKESYDFRLILLMIVNYIVLPMFWFYNQILRVDENSILSKQAFWISISLLVWITFFTFKMIPLYFLYSNDKEFLNTVDIIFQYANVISYILFLRALFCKL